LRDAIHKNGLTLQSVADQIGVDPKTVERWITKDRPPYPKHRQAVAAIVKQAEAFLWPGIIASERAAAVSRSEIAHVYPRRAAVPPDLFQHLLDGAIRKVGILAYAALFLPEQNPRWVTTLRDKANAGVKVEILLGDPEGGQIAERGADEGIGNAMGSKVRNVLSYYHELRDIENVAIYFHDTTLYNSIYRFDDEMLVNSHLYGTPAAYAPVIHLHRLTGGEIFDNYASSFDRVLSQAKVAWPDHW
jgi:lambda repressor-like predicted transcriptional regulator